MATDQDIDRAVVDRGRLPANWPTGYLAPAFCEQLGRAVATFSSLEEILKKAIFAHTVMQEFETDAEWQEAYQSWKLTLEKVLTDTLKPLADAFGMAVHANPKNTTDNIDDLVAEIKKAAVIRNLLCHGSWGAPDAQGRSLPFYVNKNNEVCVTPLGVDALAQVQESVVELAVAVINSVTHIGYRFPGDPRPGKRVWP